MLLLGYVMFFGYSSGVATASIYFLDIPAILLLILVYFSYHENLIVYYIVNFIYFILSILSILNVYITGSYYTIEVYLCITIIVTLIYYFLIRTSNFKLLAILFAGLIILTIIVILDFSDYRFILSLASVIIITLFLTHLAGLNIIRKQKQIYI